MFRVPGFVFRVPGSVLRVSCFVFLVSRLVFGVFCFVFRAPAFKVRVPSHVRIPDFGLPFSGIGFGCLRARHLFQVPQLLAVVLGIERAQPRLFSGLELESVYQKSGE